MRRGLIYSSWVVLYTLGSSLRWVVLYAPNGLCCGLIYSSCVSNVCWVVQHVLCSRCRVQSFMIDVMVGILCRFACILWSLWLGDILPLGLCTEFGLRVAVCRFCLRCGARFTPFSVLGATPFSRANCHPNFPRWLPPHFSALTPTTFFCSACVPRIHAQTPIFRVACASISAATPFFPY